MYLVTGATGNVGSEVVRALHDRDQKVRALTRTVRPDSAFPPGVEAVVGDLDHPDGIPLDGVRGAFLLPGYEGTPVLLAALRDAGAERVVLLSGGSAGSGDMTNAVTAYMIRSERAVRESGLVWTVLRPSGFMSNALRWLPQLAAGDVVRLPFASVATSVVDPADIAAVAAEALLGDGHAGAVHVPTGPESLLPGDQVGALGEALGRDLRFEAQPDDEARAEMLAGMPAEYVDAFFDFFVAGSLDESQVRSTVQDVTGRAPRTFGQWAAAHADAFR